MQRSIDLTLSFLATVVAFGLSWPYWRSFSYFAESRAAWTIYFLLGAALAVYVFYVFFRALRTIFMHEGHDHAHHEHDHASDHAHDHAHGLDGASVADEVA
jgi:ABC-type nickel/cobalt efflux system permease component RcnA